MKDLPYRANATEINKSPIDIRYVFILVSHRQRDYVNTTTTYRSLRDTLLKGKTDSLKVVDIPYGIVNNIKLELAEDLLDAWRENYFNPEWDIPFQFIM